MVNKYPINKTLQNIFVEIIFQKEKIFHCWQNDSVKTWMYFLFFACCCCFWPLYIDDDHYHHETLLHAIYSFKRQKQNRKNTLHFWVKSIFGCLKKEKVYHHIHMNTKKNKPTENEWIFPPQKNQPKKLPYINQNQQQKTFFFFLFWKITVHQYETHFFYIYCLILFINNK